MSERDRALETIARLIERHDIARADLLALTEGPSTGPASSVLARVMGYLGGLLIVAGIGTFVALNWDSFGSLLRVLTTLGLGLALFVAGLALGRRETAHALTTPFLLLAEVLQPTGILVALDEYGPGGDAQLASVATGAVVAVQAAAARLWTDHPVLLLAATFFGFAALGTLADWLGVDAELIGLVIGFAAVSLAIGLRRPAHALPAELIAGVGALLGFLALWSLIEDSPAELLFAAVTGLGVTASVFARLRALLAISVLALLGYITHLTSEYVQSTLGWPLSLLLLGGVFLAVGHWALRLSQRHFRPADSR